MTAPSRREPNEQNEPQRRTEPSEEAVMPAPRSEALNAAAYEFVEDLVKRGKFDAPADNVLGWGYLWHGWALQDAFKAGAAFARSATPASAGSERAVAEKCAEIIRKRKKDWSEKEWSGTSLAERGIRGALEYAAEDIDSYAATLPAAPSGSEHSARAVAEWEAAFRDLFSNCGRSDDTDEAIERARKFLLDHRATLPTAPSSSERAVAEVVLDNLPYLENLIDLRGHESGLLKNHPLPCAGHDFCLMRQAQKGADAIREAAAALRALPAAPKDAPKDHGEPK